MLKTIEEAQAEMKTVEQDVIADMGVEAYEAGYYDLVREVASRCTDEVAIEFLRRNGI